MKTTLRTACILLAAIASMTVRASIVKIQPGVPEFDCEDRENLYVPFIVLHGTVDQIENINFVDTVHKYNKRVDINGDNTLTIHIGGLKPGVYRGELKTRDWMNDTTVTCPLSFSIRFQAANEDTGLGGIFRHKYYNVLAVYTNSASNGGFTFEKYQWYWKNQADTIAYEGDSAYVIDPIFKPIEGATESIYHQEEELVPGDEYYVELTYTDKQGYINTISSCPQVIQNKHPEPEEEEEEDSAAKKLIRGGRLVIEKNEHTYDLYGNQVD